MGRIMSLEYIANLAEIVGVLLVVASLIYVAKQLRQNTNAIRAQSRQSVLVASQSELFAQVAHPSLTLSIIDRDPITEEEQVRLSSWLFALFRGREFAWYGLRFRHQPQWCLVVENNSMNEGAKLRQLPCANAQHQQYRFEWDDDRRFCEL